MNRPSFSREPQAFVVITREAGVVVARMLGHPFVSEGANLDSALTDLAAALREYAENWDERLQHAPNHGANRGLVHFVKQATDKELLDWLDDAGTRCGRQKYGR